MLIGVDMEAYSTLALSIANTRSNDIYKVRNEERGLYPIDPVKQPRARNNIANGSHLGR